MNEDRKQSTRPWLRAAAVLFTVVACLFLAVWVLGDGAYLWVKAIHLVAVVSWMVGLLYLPRLFVYHSDAAAGSELSETIKVMERRLIRIIATPAMVLTWVLGLWLGWRGQHYFQLWFVVKLLLVVGLSGLHIYFALAAKKFAADERPLSGRQWRIMNEVPAFLMLLIIVLVIVKPI